MTDNVTNSTDATATMVDTIEFMVTAYFERPDPQILKVLYPIICDQCAAAQWSMRGTVDGLSAMRVTRRLKVCCEALYGAFRTERAEQRANVAEERAKAAEERADRVSAILTAALMHPADAARARLAELQRDPTWGSRLLSGDKDAQREFAALSVIANGG